jgi:hypothetical protein
MKMTRPLILGIAITVLLGAAPSTGETTTPGPFRLWSVRSVFGAIEAFSTLSMRSLSWRSEASAQGQPTRLGRSERHRSDHAGR